jgi:hypothetical protein
VILSNFERSADCRTNPLDRPGVEQCTARMRVFQLDVLGGAPARTTTPPRQLAHAAVADGASQRPRTSAVTVSSGMGEI